MMKEIRRRPMVRPLFIWIMGILCQVNGRIADLSFFLLVIPFLFLFFSCGKRAMLPSFYSVRWVWGVQCLLLLFFLSIQFTAFHERKEGFTDSSFVGYREALSLREKFLEDIDRLTLSGSEKSLLATIVLGYRQGLPKEVRQQFAATGTAHILAVSGMHVGIVAAFISFFLSFFSKGRKSRFFIYLCVLLFVWWYILITGAAASAVRAGWMISFYLTGRQFVRNTDSYNTMAAAAFCMLVWNPFYLFDIGFQLSFIAVFFILYLEPLLRSGLQTQNPLLAVPVSWVTVACAAQIGVTFLSVYYFDSVTLLFLFTALPVMLLVTCLMPASLIWLVYPEVGPGYNLLKRLVEWNVSVLSAVVENFSRVSVLNFSFSLNKQTVLVGYFFLFVLIEYFRRKYKVYLHKKNYL